MLGKPDVHYRIVKNSPIKVKINNHEGKILLMVIRREIQHSFDVLEANGSIPFSALVGEVEANYTKVKFEKRKQVAHHAALLNLRKGKEITLTFKILSRIRGSEYKYFKYLFLYYYTVISGLLPVS